MTRPFEAKYHCNNCHTWQTQETELGRWIRNNPELPSSKYCVTDLDWMVTEYKSIHQYKTAYGRDFQLMMIVESKIMGADVNPAQRDTLHMLNQIIRNRRATPTKGLIFQSGNAPVEVYSVINGRKVLLRHYGVHSLRFSALGPNDSEWIKWDQKEITIDQLTGLFQFNIDPDTLKPIDLRNHHAVVNHKQNQIPIEERAA
jgi:hypothetical protein